MTQLNSTELNWLSWTAYSQVTRVFVHDVTTYKLSQLGHDVENWSVTVVHAVNTSTIQRRVELCRYKRAFTHHMLFHHYTPTSTLWSTNQFFLDLPRFSTELGERSFSYLAPTVWNGLLLLTSDFHPLLQLPIPSENSSFQVAHQYSYQCCPPRDCQCIWFSIITECVCIINACIII